MSKRQQFRSHLTTILTMIGVSVGLGNVWRFPYMMGLYGGSAFLFIYLLFTLFLAVPAVTAEWALGRYTRQGPIGAFSQAIHPTVGHIIGYLLLITVTVADSYYIVVISNVITTAGYSMAVGFSPSSLDQYYAILSSGTVQYALSMIILAVSIYVIYLGLNRGIEQTSKFIVPFFLLLMVYLIGHALFFSDGIDYLLIFLQPDFSKITPQVIFAAMGQAFFSLGLGGTFLLIYGSYMKKEQPIIKGAILTGLGDVGAAILAGLFMVPAMMAFNLDLASGPGLLFNTLPQLFANMPLGRVVGTLFLLGLAMVAFLSNIAALEVVAGGLSDSQFVKFSRNQIIFGLAIVEAVIIFPSAFFPESIGTLDLIFGSAMQTIGSGLTIIAICWGIGRRETLHEITGQHTETWWGQLLFFWLKWIIPLALLITLVIYLIDSI